MKKLNFNYCHSILLCLFCFCCSVLLTFCKTKTQEKCVYVNSIVETENVDPIVQNNKRVFLTVHNSNNMCGNCEALLDSLNQLINEKKLCNCVIIKCYDGSQQTNRDLVAKGLINNGMMATPACLIYINGKCKEGYSGYKSTNDIYSLLKKYNMTCENCRVER